jgi:hypothetical protein
MGSAGRGGKQDIDRVGGRYRLIERLGTGGMAVVWRGYDEILGRQVAVKVLDPHLAATDSFRDRLRQEALAAARLCHPHITGIFDFGEYPHYVVMELNNGESLSARLARKGPLSWPEAVILGTEVASALATAHARGIVHRDVTPANVMLTSTGAKVVDFGISALVGQRDAAPDGSLLGTPAYLAPERLGGGQVSPATDVYALGLLLYRALTGRLPWPAGTTTEALRAHLYTDPEPLPPIDGLPGAAAELCLRCLAKQPADRPGAAEIARSLGALVGIHPVISPLDSEFPAALPVRPIASTRTTEAIPIARRPSRPPAVAVLTRLGLPPVPPAVLRLRAGLWIGTVLHLGAVRPLGGGLFTRRPTAPVLAGRHRLQAAAATIALLVALGVSWSATRAPADSGPAQAAAVGVGPVLPPPTGCKVRYQVRQDNGEDFEALLSVLNTGERSFGRWRLEFVFPGTQRLVNLPRTVDQSGRRVRLRAAGGGQLVPGQAVAVTLRGVYRDTNPLPLAFDLNGHSCDVELLGPTTITPSAAADADDSQVGTTRSKKSGERPRHSTGRHHSTHRHHKPQPARRTPKKAADPAPPPPPVSKTGGFSMSV